MTKQADTIEFEDVIWDKKKLKKVSTRDKASLGPANIVGQMKKIAQDRAVFEANEYARSNQKLYEILAEAYEQYLLAKQTQKLFKETVQQLVSILTDEGSKVQTNTLAINLFVRFVFRSDRQRAHNYSRTLQAAVAMNIKPQDLPKFITDCGGVEECKKQVEKSNTVVQKKLTIAQAMPRVVELIKEAAVSPIATFNVGPEVVAKSFDEEMTFLIGKTDKSGNVSVVSVVPGYSAGFAKWAKQQLAIYLAEQMSVSEQKAKQEEREVLIDDVVRNSKKHVVAGETVGELMAA